MKVLDHRPQALVCSPMSRETSLLSRYLQDPPYGLLYVVSASALEGRQEVTARLLSS
jgi:hypothetical protein